MTALKKSIAALALTLPFTAFAQAPAAPAEPAAPAAAPEPPKTPLVSVYGTLNVNFQYAEAGDATAAPAGSPAGVAAYMQDVSPRTGISIDSSNIGVRGGADVAHGLKVVYQCETQASIDGVDTRAICNRNSRVGLASEWGTLFYGNWDTPFKAAAYGTKADDPFGNTDVFGFNSVFGSPGYGVKSTVFNGGANAGFDIRAANSVAYWSPKIAGASFKVQYGTNEERSAEGTIDPQLLSAVVNYDLAGLSLAAAFDYHEDLYGLRQISLENGTDRASKDWAWKLAAGYEIPLPVGALTVMGMLEQLNYAQDDAATGLEDYDRVAWLLGAKFRTGNHELRARYTQALDPNCTLVGGADCPDTLTEDLGAQQIALGYAYHLAKSTQLFAFYSQIMNDDFAQYTFGVSGPARIVGTRSLDNHPLTGDTETVSNTPFGADPMAIGVGIRHAF